MCVDEKTSKKPKYASNKPFAKNVEAILIKSIINPSWKKPPSIPSLGINLQHPILKVLEIPKVALKTDEPNIIKKLSGISRALYGSRKIRHIWIITVGILSI